MSGNVSNTVNTAKTSPTSIVSDEETVPADTTTAYERIKRMQGERINSQKKKASPILELSSIGRGKEPTALVQNRGNSSQENQDTEQDHLQAYREDASRVQSVPEEIYSVDDSTDWMEAWWQHIIIDVPAFLNNDTNMGENHISASLFTPAPSKLEANVAAPAIPSSVGVPSAGPVVNQTSQSQSGLILVLLCVIIGLSIPNKLQALAVAGYAYLITYGHTWLQWIQGKGASAHCPHRLKRLQDNGVNILKPRKVKAVTLSPAFVYPVCVKAKAIHIYIYTYRAISSSFHDWRLNVLEHLDYEHQYWMACNDDHLEETNPEQAHLGSLTASLSSSLFSASSAGSYASGRVGPVSVSVGAPSASLVGAFTTPALSSSVGAVVSQPLILPLDMDVAVNISPWADCSSDDPGDKFEGCVADLQTQGSVVEWEKSVESAMAAVFMKPEPGAYKQALDIPGWHDSLQRQVSSMYDQQVWEDRRIADLPPITTVIDFKWVYKDKAYKHALDIPGLHDSLQRQVPSMYDQQVWKEIRIADLPPITTVIDFKWVYKDKPGINENAGEELRFPSLFPPALLNAPTTPQDLPSSPSSSIGRGTRPKAHDKNRVSVVNPQKEQDAMQDLSTLTQEQCAPASPILELSSIGGEQEKKARKSR